MVPRGLAKKTGELVGCVNFSEGKNMSVGSLASKKKKCMLRRLENLKFNLNSETPTSLIISSVPFHLDL